MIETATHAGWVRSENEDAAAARALPGGATLLVVADGVGGAPGGALAAQLAIETVLARLGDGVGDDEPAAALNAAFTAAARLVHARRTGTFAEMCTTLVAALVTRQARGGAWASVANVGDSRAYALLDKALRQVTRDHSWVAEELRSGRLAPDDPVARARRHIITRAIGSTPAPTVDVFEIGPLRRGDALLLCSDGLHAVIADAEIEALLTPPVRGVAERLVRAALDRGGDDNVTVSIYAPNDDASTQS